MKILLAADGSEFTRRAASFVASNLAELSKPPEIHLLNVHAPIPVPRAASVAGSDVVDKYHKEECEAALAVAEGVFKGAGVKYQATWVVGKAGEEIAAYAAKHGMDLVVVGSHGHGALRTLALGSVADEVLRSAKCPVLVVK